MNTQKPKLVIVGKGAFGKLMAHYLRPYSTVSFLSRSDSLETISRRLNGCDIVIYSVPMSGLEKSVIRTKPFISLNTVIVDVTSVKVKPLQLLKKYFKHNQILGMHPILGPQSVKRNGGLSGLPLVLCDVSCEPRMYTKIKQFCKNKLELRVIEQSPGKHDREMAAVQGLSHFIGRALKHMDISDYATSTESYKQLLELRDLLAGDSWDVFETIQNTNTQTKRIRHKFLTQLEKIENKLN